MVEYKDVMLGMAAVAATVAGFGLVFLAIVTTSFAASRMVLSDFLLLAFPALATIVLGMVTVGVAMAWLIQHAGHQGHPDIAYALAVWGFRVMGAAAILTAFLFVLAHWVYKASGVARDG